MQRIEVVDALLVMIIQHGQKSDDDTRERECVEDRVKQFHVDAADAAADTVQENRWNEKDTAKNLGVIICCCICSNILIELSIVNY